HSDLAVHCHLRAGAYGGLDRSVERDAVRSQLQDRSSAPAVHRRGRARSTRALRKAALIRALCSSGLERCFGTAPWPVPSPKLIAVGDFLFVCRDAAASSLP